ncbi:MAG: hypothetical protein J0M00_02000 [Burkholderiales bacterium]|nr:hypothetical protein [Burkholderiales bacterium]
MAEEARKNAAKRRSALFMSFIGDFTRPVKIVDLGGTVAMWERWGLDQDRGLHVTLVNNYVADTNGKFVAPRVNNFLRLDADVAELGESFYRQFDLVFSNSMLEHLPTRLLQKRVASAIVGSGMPYFIQVPNKRSLIDPHFAHPLAPFFASWPRSLQKSMLLVSGLNGGKRHRSFESAGRRLEAYCPLSIDDTRQLFGDAVISLEWSYGIPMSIVARKKGHGRMAESVS